MQLEKLVKYAFSRMAGSLKYFDLFIDLTSFRVSGRYNRIYYTTRRNYESEAYSLRVAFAHDMIPYHIECSPKIRIGGGDGKLPRWGDIVALAIAWSVAEARDIDDVDDETDLMRPLFKNSRIVTDVHKTLENLKNASFRTLTWTNSTIFGNINKAKNGVINIAKNRGRKKASK